MTLRLMSSLLPLMLSAGALLGSGCAHSNSLAPEPVLLPLPLNGDVVMLDEFPGVFDELGTGARWMIERYPESPSDPAAPAAPYRIERRGGDEIQIYAGYLHPGVSEGVYILQLVPGALPINEGLALSHFALGSTLFQVEIAEEGLMKLRWLEGRSLMKMSGDGVKRLQTKGGGAVLVGDGAALIDGAEYARVGGEYNLQRYVQEQQPKPQ